MIPKFRAWDIDGRCMVYQNDNGDEYVWEIGANDVWICYICDGEIPEQILMQSTGLKDKNGVEIFEGDIVKTLGADLKVTFSTIKFAEGAFCVDYKNRGTEFDFLYFVDSPLEVIGNIYQNPELLDSDLVEVER